jgi:hypothetical protein
MNKERQRKIKQEAIANGPGLNPLWPIEKKVHCQPWTHG